MPRWIKENIERILVKADLVTASSDKLYHMAKSQRKKNSVFLVGNGVDYDHFGNRPDVVVDNDGGGELQ